MNSGHLTVDAAHQNASQFSPCGRYRYWLRECLTGSMAQDVLDPPKRPLVFCMLNPSSAGRVNNGVMTSDPTVRRCSGYARALGYTDRIVVNMFAWISTDPAELLRVPDPVGPENDAMIGSLPSNWPVICAWGSHKLTLARAHQVVALLHRPLFCLKQTKNGSPSHPLYLKSELKPVPWALP